jgi:hypothetical protein
MKPCFRFSLILIFFILAAMTTSLLYAQSSGLFPDVSFYPPRMNPGQTTNITIFVRDSNNNPVPGVNVNIRAPEQGYFLQTNNRFSVGITNQSGMYSTAWRASPTPYRNSNETFQITVSKSGYYPFSLNHPFIVDQAIYNW